MPSRKMHSRLHEHMPLYKLPKFKLAYTLFLCRPPEAIPFKFPSFSALSDMLQISVASTFALTKK